MTGWKRIAVFLCLLSISLGLPTRAASALSLHVVRDTISTSKKASPADHLINFTATRAVPAGGHIIITPASGAFDIPSDMAIGDIDFALASTSTHIDRSVATTSDAVSDGVTIVPGTSGSIIITLNSSEGIAAGNRLEVRIGTIASYDEVGIRSITNPATTGSYRIHIATSDASDVPIDVADAMIAIVEQVGVSVFPLNLAPIRSNAFPSGIIAAGTTAVELSLETDQLATCKYSTVASTSYAAMTNYFSPRTTRTFSAVVTGFADDTNYTYYVRCESLQHTANTDDFEISFTLGPTPGTKLSLPDGTQTGSGNVGHGSGDFPNGSLSLYLASMSLAGWTIPASTVSVLVDGKQQLTARSKSDGSFRTEVSGLERGTHTISAYVTDSGQRKSATFTSTLTLDSGTTNLINNAVIPPTIALDSDTADIGDTVLIYGEGSPGTVEIMLARKSDTAKPTDVKLYTATTSTSTTARLGTWAFAIPGRDLSKGAYLIRARTIRTEEIDSDFGKAVTLGVGQSAPPNLGNRSDINKDGKVNLIDFSIMLVSWGKDDPDADINQDGTVNLADFSILLFNWTG